MAYRDLDVLDAARGASDQLNALIDKRRRRRLVHVPQMRESMQSVIANILEAFGRGMGRVDRDKSLKIARGEADETNGHLATNFQTRRLEAKEYWPLHNRLVVIVKMLNGIIYGP